MATPGGGITKLVAAGDVNSGSTFFSPTLNSFPPSSLDATGQVVFRALVLGLNGIYGRRAARSNELPRQEAPAPGGGTFSTLSGASAINSAGQVAFFATTTGGPGQNQGVFVGTPGGAVAKIAVSADPAPGGGTFSQFSGGGFSFNDSGEVAFQASLNGGAGIGAFVGSTSSLQAVALNGAPAPAGGNFSLNANQDILINNQHDVVFRAALTGGSADSGYFLRRGTNGTLQTVAVQGQAAPGTPGTFATIPSTFNNFVGESLSLGPSGEVAFTNRSRGRGFTLERSASGAITCWKRFLPGATWRQVLVTASSLGPSREWAQGARATLPRGLRLLAAMLEISSTSPASPLVLGPRSRVTDVTGRASLG